MEKNINDNFLLEDNECDKEKDKEGKSSFNISDKLLKARRIVISSDVNSKSADKIIQQLLALEVDNPEEDITMFINSPGGEVYSGFAIYDIMQAITPKVKTVIMGFAASFGSILAIGGEKGHRYAFPNSKILIHQPLISGVVRASTTDIEIHAKEMLRLKNRLVDIYVEETGQTAETIRRDFERDYWMTAEEAKNYGLVNKIILKTTEI